MMPQRNIYAQCARESCSNLVGRHAKFCSPECWYAARRASKKLSRVVRYCERCGKEFFARLTDIKRGKGRFCSHSCSTGARSFKGGFRINQGYMYWLRPHHPNADVNGYVKRANLIMESILKRYLNPQEIVHHIDSNKLNDHPKNLRLFESKKSHEVFHSKTRKRDKRGMFV